jgi:hypothetical protein
MITLCAAGSDAGSLVHREDLPMISSGVLGEEAWPMNPHTLGVGASAHLPGQAIRALATVDVRVHRHLLSRPGARYGFVVLADRLVTRRERVDANVGPMVQVQVRAAGAAR